MLSFKLVPVLVASAVLSAAAIASAAAPAVVPAAQVPGMRDLGPLGAATPVRIAVLVRYQHEAELEQLVAAQADPSSPMYHRFLSQAGFRSYFSATASEYALTVSALRRAGFTIASEYDNRTLVDAIAPAFTVERTFATQLHRVTQPGGGVGYANVGPATIPATMPYVKGIAGLDNRHAWTPSIAHAAAAPPMVPGDAKLVGPDGGFSPEALRRAYDFPVVHGFDGAGVKIADFMDGAPIASDVSTFLTHFGLKQTGPFTIVPVDGGCGKSCADNYSADFDVEWIAAMAPGASIYEYQLPALYLTETIDGFNKIISDDIVDVVHIPFGICEGLAPNYATIVTAVLKQGSATGISFSTLSAGGAPSCGAGYPLVPETPADSSVVLGSGLSFLATDASGEWLAETASPASSGGVSIIEPVPAAQRAIKGVKKAGRNVPDLTVPQLINGNGASAYLLGKWDGDSFYNVVTSQTAGMIGEWVQMSGHRLGPIDLTLYHIFSANGFGSSASPLFRDIIFGCDGTYDNEPICARSGYDTLTGIGSPDAFNLGEALQ